jgi:hypothetical protein
MKQANQQRVRFLTGLTLLCLSFFPAASAKAGKPAQRRIELDVAQASQKQDAEQTHKVEAELKEFLETSLASQTDSHAKEP